MSSDESRRSICEPTSQVACVSGCGVNCMLKLCRKHPDVGGMRLQMKPVVNTNHLLLPLLFFWTGHRTTPDPLQFAAATSHPGPRSHFLLVTRAPLCMSVSIVHAVIHFALSSCAINRMPALFGNSRGTHLFPVAFWKTALERLVTC